MLRLGLAAAALPIFAACIGSTSSSSPSSGTQPSSTSAASSGTPTAGGTTQAPGASKAKISGKFQVVVDTDFYPEHNAFIEKKIREFAETQGYPLDFSTVSAYTGQANLAQRLSAAVQANDAPDVITHTEKPSVLKFLDVLEDVDELQNDVIREYGPISPSLERANKLDGKWWAVTHFTRANGYWARETPFNQAGIDIRKDLDDWDKVRDAALRMSQTSTGVWGWGMTTNRGGDGEALVREYIMMHGGQLTDEAGEIVVLNKDPYRRHTIEALASLKEIYTSPTYAPMLPTGVQAWTDTGNNEAYLAGKIAYTYNAGTMFAKALVDKNPVADDTFLLMPPKGTGPGGRQLANAATPKRWMILKGAKNRQAAEQLIRYMLSSDVQRELFKISSGYVYPAYQWGWDEPEIAQGRAATQVGDIWKQYLNHPSGYYGESAWPGPPTPWSASLDSSNFWTDMFGEILGGKPVEQTVADAHDRAVRVFREFGAKG
ncbi:MAG: carbohydrate ABC transporter substrate-binding protein [Chloroflexi bacterium]|nr:carbohydrate ABC transporter substrate-binding protein [Chloroflexota bacterium]